MVAFSARFGVRSLQAASGLATMIFTSLGYIKFTTGQLSSASAIFTTVAAYSALLCGAYFAVFVELLQKSNGPKLWMQRGLDALLTTALVIAGILHATSNAVKYCENYNAMFEGYHGSGLFRCGSMSFAIVLTFVTAGLSLVALVLSFVRRPTEAATEEQQQTEVVDVDAHRPALKFTRRTSRLLQFICALVAMITTVAGYKHYYTGQYTSPAATFAILATYTGMVYGLWHVAAVETLKVSRRPTLSAERAIDAVLAVALLVAGVIFVSSAQVEDCKANNEEFETYHGTTLFRCGNMNLGVVFTFITVLMLAATFGLSFLYGSNNEDLFSLARASKDRSAIRFIRLGGRSLQALCAIVGMIFTSTSYIKFTTGQLSSASAIFTTVACYTAMLVGLYHAVLVELLQKTRGPKIWVQRGIDVVVAAVLGVAGSLHAASNAVRYCDDYNAMFEGYHGSGLFRCGSMSVSIAMAYVTMAISLVLLALSFVRGGTNTPTLQEEHTVNGFHALHTPVVKPGEVSCGAEVQLERPALRMARRTSRVLQFAFSLVAMIATIAGYKHYYTGQYTSPAATYTLLITYTGMLYGLWHVTAVETFKLSSRATVSVERLVDGVLAVALLVAGIIFVTSSQVEDCESSNEEFAKYHGTTLFRCGTMNLGVFFSFVSVAVYLVTFALSFFYPRSLSDGDSDATSDVQESVRVSHAPSDPSTSV